MKLPLELQGMLWRFTWTDRVVIIQVGKLENPIQTWLKDETPETRFRAEAEQIEFQDAFHPNVKGFKKDIIHTPAQLPSTLFVNRESRHETLRHYRLAFQLPGYESRIYFHPGMDIPCLARHNLSNFQGCVDLAEVDELMVMSARWCHPLGDFIFQIPKVDEDWSKKWMHNFTGLNPNHVVAVCPKVVWLYWHSNYRYEVDPWEMRTLEKPELIVWSRKWGLPPAGLAHHRNL